MSSFHTLCKRELLSRDGIQPHQNLGRPQTIMWCFATQFEITSERMEIFAKKETGI